MAIVKMKRLRLIALSEERDELLSKLLHMGCVEVTEPQSKLSDPEWSGLLGRDTSRFTAVRGEVNEVTNALGALKKYAPTKGNPLSGIFFVRKNVTEAEFFDEDKAQRALSDARTINGHVAKINQLTNQENRLIAHKENLEPWKTLEMPLELESTETTEVVMGAIPAAAELDNIRAELAAEAPLCELIRVGEDEEEHYVLIICHKEQFETAQQVLKPHTFSAVRFKELTGTAAENLTAIEAELSQIAVDRDAEEAAIRAMAPCREELQHAFDRFMQDAEKESVCERSLTDGTINFFEGWVPAEKAQALTAMLEQFSCAYEFSDPQEEDTVPTLLKNPKWMRGINMVTEMYSLPAYNGIDPNPLIFGWYVLFFGYMFADVAYGLVIFFISLFITHKFKPKGTMGYMFALGEWLGASTAVIGFFVGGFCGNLISAFYENFVSGGLAAMPGFLQTFCNGIWISPVDDPMTVLIVAIVMGCIHLVMGQLIHIYMGFRDHNGVDALLDVVPWWIVFAGIAAMMLADTSVVLIIGIIGLLCTQGRHKQGVVGKIIGGVASLYDITSWLSDVLSYARLMALMLATTVVAQVFNTLGALPKIFVVFAVVAIVGNAFNIIINIIGTYVHAARLQYIEYFNKFYVEGGIPFRPLKYNTKYVDIIEEDK